MLCFNFNKCDHCKRCMRCDLYLSPEWAFLISILLGALFAGYSWGFVYAILFLLIWEIGYYIYTGYADKSWNWVERLGLVLGALFGFIIGRTLHHKADHAQDYNDFKSDMRYYFRECGWMD